MTTRSYLPRIHKKMKIQTLLLSLPLLLLITVISCRQERPGQSYSLLSPDGRIAITVTAGNGSPLQYRVDYGGKAIFLDSPISMTLAGGNVLGRNTEVEKTDTAHSDKAINPVYSISDTLRDRYNELTLHFKGNYAVVFRAYNEGMAYRLVTRLPGQITVEAEEVQFNLAGNYPGYFHPVGFESSSEEKYTYRTVADLAGSDTNMTSLPVLLDVPGGPKIALLESDLLDYAGLYLMADGGSRPALTGTLPAYPKRVKQGGHGGFNLRVEEREDFIARTQGTRSFPWRIAALVPGENELLTNQLVYLLASESKIGDASWIRPGKVSWDWWASLNLEGVPFKTGFNTDTYKYYIDFAAQHGIEYVNLDEGWSDQFDLLKVTDKLDMPEVVRYAREKKVGLSLWCVWHTLDKQMIPALDQFEKWGISVLKVDFMDRDDQEMVNFYERLLREAAKRKIMVNYHGAYKPTGLQRTYPNNINKEGVRGLEWNKGHKEGATPEYAVTVPFIRMVAGSMDYTPGAMTNANKKDWRPVFDRPMSLGTRCHQLAMYVVYYGPLQMLSDSPTAYQKEPEVLDFLKTVPTVWDETRPLQNKVGDYVSIARRKGNTWYAGAMTDWTARDLTLRLDFLGEGSYQAELFSDGVNAHRIGNDYQKTKRQVTRGETITVTMAPGGGWAAKFTPLL
jgi:alpha-glucosidase